MTFRSQICAKDSKKNKNITKNDRFHICRFIAFRLVASRVLTHPTSVGSPLPERALAETVFAPTDKSTTKRYTRDVRTLHQIGNASPHRTIGKAKKSNRRRIPEPHNLGAVLFAPRCYHLRFANIPVPTLKWASGSGVFQGACPLNAFFVSFLCKQKRKHRVLSQKFIRNRVVRTH